MKKKREQLSKGTLPALIPENPLRQPLKFELTKLLVSITKISISAGTTNWTAAGKELADASTAIGLKPKYKTLAWLLVRRALTRALCDLIEPYRYRASRVKTFSEHELQELLDRALNNASLELGPEFLEKPGELPFLASLANPVSFWFGSFNFNAQEASSLFARLRTYFVYALHQECFERHDEYRLVLDFFRSPFKTALKRELAWSCYRAWLKRTSEKNLFLEAFSVSQFYVPLRAYFSRYEFRQLNFDVNSSDDTNEEEDSKERKSIDEDETAHKSESKPTRKRVTIEHRHVVDLHESLDAWVESNNPIDAIRFVSGGPGNGKSTCAKMFAARCADNPNTLPILVALNEFELSNDLLHDLGRYLSFFSFFEANPLNPQNIDRRLLLIFDGLDEIALRGKVGIAAARSFVDQVKQLLVQFNRSGFRLQVLITGRDVAVSMAQSLEYPNVQTLHLLPYQISDQKFVVYDDPKQLKTIDQRAVWWTNYCALQGGNPEETLLRFKNGHIEEATAQPLLNYLLAVALPEIKEPVLNVSVVYEKLLSAIYNRQWDWSQHRSLKAVALTQFEFITILKAFALGVWRKNRQFISLAEVQADCPLNTADHLFNRFMQGFQKGVTDFLVSFYFREFPDEGGDQIFEFTHKSFVEFLVAKTLFDHLSYSCIKWHDYSTESHKETFLANILESWARLSGEREIDQYIYTFIKGLLESQTRERLQDFHMFIKILIKRAIRDGFPLERLKGVSYKRMEIYSKNALDSLMIFMFLCTSLTKNFVRFSFPYREPFFEMLYRLEGRTSVKKSANVHESFLGFSLSR